MHIYILILCKGSVSSVVTNESILKMKPVYTLNTADFWVFHCYANVIAGYSLILVTLKYSVMSLSMENLLVCTMAHGGWSLRKRNELGSVISSAWNSV